MLLRRQSEFTTRGLGTTREWGHTSSDFFVKKKIFSGNFGSHMFLYIFLGIFSIIGLLLGGPLVDKFDTKKTAITTLLPLLLLLVVLITFEGEFFLIIYMSLFGLTMGIGRPFIGSLWAEIYGVESLGTVKALLHAAAVFASALSPLVFGYLIDWGFSITTIVTISILIIIVSTLLPIYNKLP